MQARLGATNWELDNYPEGETEETIAERKAILLAKFNSPTINEHIEHEEILENLCKTFKTQREFFNNFADLPKINNLLEKWPILSSKVYLLYHYSLQMGHSINQLRNGFNKDRHGIFAYGKACNLTDAESADYDYEVLKIIFKYFEEDIESFFLLCEPDSDLLNMQVPLDGPCIIITG